jgi:hypothetical protein
MQQTGATACRTTIRPGTVVRLRHGATIQDASRSRKAQDPLFQWKGLCRVTSRWNSGRLYFSDRLQSQVRHRIGACRTRACLAIGILRKAWMNQNCFSIQVGGKGMLDPDQNQPYTSHPPLLSSREKGKKSILFLVSLVC